MNNKPTYLVSCVSQKRETPSAAKDLYVSAWFKKARIVAEKNSSRWFILSAKYGLLEPERTIPPYEKTLATASKKERVGWAKMVIGQTSKLDNGNHLVLLAGIKYREFLVPGLKEKGFSVEVPMFGLAIGKQLQWLSNAK